MSIEDNFASAVSLEKVVEILAGRFGLRGSLAPLPGEFDLNFRLDGSDGHAHIVKIMHPARDDAWNNLQIEILAHITARDPHIPVPKIRPTRDQAFSASLPLVDGRSAVIWVQEFLPGRLLGRTKPHSEELLHHFGSILGKLNNILADFDHPAAHRLIKWDLKQAAWITRHFDLIDDPEKRNLIESFWERISNETINILDDLPHSIVHNDPNDYNVLALSSFKQPQKISGLFDFGDAVYSLRVADLAIGGAYALLEKDDPLTAVAFMTAGYASAQDLTAEEVDHLFNLVCLRLCVSVVNAAVRKRRYPDDEYIIISEKPAWEALARLQKIHPRLARCRLRMAAGLEPYRNNPELVAWLKENRGRFSPVAAFDPGTQPVTVLDLSVASLELGANPLMASVNLLTKLIEEKIAAEKTTLAVGRWNEPRLIYDDPSFDIEGSNGERRTIHLGLDLFLPAGEPIFAPLEGVVIEAAENAAPFDYGPLIILKHDPPGIAPFFTLYGHLSRETLSEIKSGQAVMAGDQIGTIGAPPINGNWPPHLHFQIIGDLLDLGRDFPGVAPPNQREVWSSLCPDPNLIIGIPDAAFPTERFSPSQIAHMRHRLLGNNLSLSYQKPINVVRGWRQYLYDHEGRAFLDMYNNVPHVGHSHPRVVEAIQRQTGLLNTNTRYLHENIVRYAAALTELLPDPLSVCFFVNSASEANELALRLARTYTEQEDIVVLEAAYHGHSTTLIDISPYKFDGPGGQGRKPWVHVAPLPDDFRGPYKRTDPDAGLNYGQAVGRVIQEIVAADRKPAALIAESLPSVGGQIIPPPGFLAEAYRHVRAAGGLCIADEVQTGLGRLGSHLWGFDMQAVVPDIVVLGKPIANGHPLGVVVTTRKIADAFDNGMEFFSTFGGNPVSCAAGLAVLEVLEAEDLQTNAARVGEFLLEELQVLAAQHPIVGDARGAGLFLGMEMIRDPETLAPHPAAAAYIVNRLRQEKILVGTDGPNHNVVKIRPPMVFTLENGHHFITRLQNILDESPFQTLKT